uniref:type IV secretory system conjugative DNA transfer family protein n=1 Tax=Maridesulfovibrio hydrothermalis TaxID=191026 RepID=UPI00047F763E
GHMGRASVSISETKRPLLTPDECMRLPGAEKDRHGKISKAGDMLIFPAGFAPIYGKQILFFLDPEFLKRAKIKAPDKSDILAKIGPCKEEPAKTDTQTKTEADRKELDDLIEKTEVHEEC